MGVRQIIEWAQKYPVNRPLVIDLSTQLEVDQYPITKTVEWTRLVIRTRTGLGRIFFILREARVMQEQEEGLPPEYCGMQPTGRIFVQGSQRTHNKLVRCIELLRQRV